MSEPNERERKYKADEVLPVIEQNAREEIEARLKGETMAPNPYTDSRESRPKYADGHAEATPAQSREEEAQDFDVWFAENELRFHHAQFSDKDMARSAWEVALRSRPAPRDDHLFTVCPICGRSILPHAHDSLKCSGCDQVWMPRVPRDDTALREAPKDEKPVTYPRKHITDASRRAIIMHAPKDESKGGGA